MSPGTQAGVLLGGGCLGAGEDEGGGRGGERDPDQGRDPGDDLLADGDAGGAPVREVLAVVAGQAVTALADTGQGPLHGQVPLGRAGAGVGDLGRTTAGEAGVPDDPDA